MQPGRQKSPGPVFEVLCQRRGPHRARTEGYKIRFGDLVTVDFDDIIGRLISAKEDHSALVGAEQTKEEKAAFLPVSVRTASASRAFSSGLS